MTREISDGIQALGAHGLRLIDQTSAEDAPMRAAMAASAAGSRTSMIASESGKL